MAHDRQEYLRRMGSATTPPTTRRHVPLDTREPSLDRRDDALFARVCRGSDADADCGFCPRVVYEEKKMNQKYAIPGEGRGLPACVPGAARAGQRRGV